MKTEIFDFDGAGRKIPNEPMDLRKARRDGCKMVALDRADSTVTHGKFYDIYNYLNEGDALVLNDSFMVHNTLIGSLNGEKIKVVLCGYEQDYFIVELHPNKNIKDNSAITFKGRELACRIVKKDLKGLWRATFSPVQNLMPAIEETAIRHDVLFNLKGFNKNPQAYRAVYSKNPGSLEIPSAGLHFTQALLTKIADKGVNIVYLTLHVGSTEILAVRHIDKEEIEDHRMKAEWYEVPKQTAEVINQCRKSGGKIFAIGTTVVRVLETLGKNIAKDGQIKAASGWTDLYIRPGFTFKVVDALLTNLHQPRSSHIVLTSAFAGTEFTLNAYKEITKLAYEFDMFGDSMLIV